MQIRVAPQLYGVRREGVVSKLRDSRQSFRFHVVIKLGEFA